MQSSFPVQSLVELFEFLFEPFLQSRLSKLDALVLTMIGCNPFVSAFELKLQQGPLKISFCLNYSIIGLFDFLFHFQLQSRFPKIEALI